MEDEDVPPVTPPIRYVRNPSKSETVVEKVCLPPTHPNSIHSSIRKVDWREKIIKFYEVWNPSKAPQVDKILEAHRGCEEQVYMAIIEKYKVKKEQSVTEEDDSQIISSTPPPSQTQSGNRIRRVRDPVTGKVFRKVVTNTNNSSSDNISSIRTPSKRVGIKGQTPSSPFSSITTNSVCDSQESTPTHFSRSTALRTPVQTPEEPLSVVSSAAFRTPPQKYSNKQYYNNRNTATDTSQLTMIESSDEVSDTPPYMTPLNVRSSSAEVDWNTPHESQSVRKQNSSSTVRSKSTEITCSVGSVLEESLGVNVRFGVQRSLEKSRHLTRGILTNKDTVNDYQHSRISIKQADRIDDPLSAITQSASPQSNSPTFLRRSSDQYPRSVSESEITSQVSETLKTLLEEQRHFFEAISKQDRVTAVTHPEIIQMKEKMMADSARCSRLETELSELKKLWIRQKEKNGDCGFREPDDEGIRVRYPIRSLSPTSPKAPPGWCSSPTDIMKSNIQTNISDGSVCGHVGSRRGMSPQRVSVSASPAHPTISGVSTCSSIYVESETAVSVASESTAVSDIELEVQQLSRQIKEVASSWAGRSPSPDNDSDDDFDIKFNSHGTLPDRVVLT